MAEEMIHECDNCDWSGTEEELGRQLFEMPDLLDRINPGCPVPSGDCPECGACCYPLDKAELERRVFPDLLAALRGIMPHLNSDLTAHESWAAEIAACQAVLDTIREALARAPK